MIDSLSTIFSCCNNINNKDNESVQQSHRNNNPKNFILEKERENLFNREEILKRRKSRNSNFGVNNNNINNNAYNLNSLDKNSSIITFSNMKVKEGKKDLNGLFDTEVLSTQELKLIGEIFWNKELYIDRIGLKIGNRIKKSGISVFGLGEQEDINGKIVIDFILNIPAGKIPFDNNNINNKNNPLFSIEYDKNEDFFVMNIINKELKIFHVIDYDFLINYGTSLEFVVGKIPIFITSPKDEDDHSIIINVEGVDYIFNKYEDCPITIGRSNSKINIKNNSISKNHAVINFLDDRNCIYIKDLESTNGTFFVLGDKCSSFKILRDMNFRILEYKFSIKTIE